MRISSYQLNAKILLETYRTIHQKNLHELERLNRQREEKYKIPPTNVWARPNKVDVYV